MTTGTPTLTWSSHAAVPAAFLGVAALTAVAAVRFVADGNPAGAVLLALAALALVAVTVVRLLRRPALVATPDMLTVRGLGRAVEVPREDVVELRVLRVGGLGPRSTVLRIESTPGGRGRPAGRTEDASPGGSEGDERLDVFSRIDLGAPPQQVAELLRSMGYPMR